VHVRRMFLSLMLIAVTACAAPVNAPSPWTAEEAVCAPVFLDLTPFANASEYYYLSLDGHDPSDSYLSHLVGLARSAGRSENMRKRSRLNTDQAKEPLLKAVNLSCGGLRWETKDRVRVSGSGLIAPLPGQAFALGGHGEQYILERRKGTWVIVRRERFWVSQAAV